MNIEQRFKIKQFYEYASDHFRSWFPLSPSYEAFNPHHLPFPEQFQRTPASENDLNLNKQTWGEIANRTFFGDKICPDNQSPSRVYFK